MTVPCVGRIKNSRSGELRGLVSGTQSLEGMPNGLGDGLVLQGLVERMTLVQQQFRSRPQRYPPAEMPAAAPGRAGFRRAGPGLQGPADLAPRGAFGNRERELVRRGKPGAQRGGDSPFYHIAG